MKAVFASLVTIFGLTVNGQGWSLPGGGATGGGFTGICNEPCTDAANCKSACAMGTFNVAVPNMDCTTIGSCAQSTFNVNGGMNSIKFGHQYAGYGSTFNFNGGKIIAIECGSGMCAGVTFNVGSGADISDLKCDEYQGCGSGCTVIQGGVSQDCYNVATT